jgi:hypothetical protein
MSVPVTGHPALVFKSDTVNFILSNTVQMSRSMDDRNGYKTTGKKLLDIGFPKDSPSVFWDEGYVHKRHCPGAYVRLIRFKKITQA